MKKKYISFLTLLATVFIGIFIIYNTNISRCISLESLQKDDNFLHLLIQENYYFALCVYIFIFSVIIGIGIPGSPALTIFSGYLFGIKMGIVYALMGSIIGSTISFLLLRYVFSNYIRAWQGDRIEKLQQKLEKNGISYLLMMHFIVIVPYFIINAVAAISSISLAMFVIITIIGSLPLIVVYTFAGEQLSTITSINDIFSLPIMGAFILLILLSTLPIIIKKNKN